MRGQPGVAHAHARQHAAAPAASLAQCADGRAWQLHDVPEIAAGCPSRPGTGGAQPRPLDALAFIHENYARTVAHRHCGRPSTSVRCILLGCSSSFVGGRCTST